MNPDYDPGRFVDIADSELGKQLWDFLWEPENVLRLEVASELHHPAVEGIAERLVERFGDAVRVDRVKQTIGHMTRQVLESRGFVLDAQNLRTRFGAGLFTRASRYRRLPRRQEVVDAR
jgi:hypothetical protein